MKRNYSPKNAKENAELLKKIFKQAGLNGWDLWDWDISWYLENYPERNIETREEFFTKNFKFTDWEGKKYNEPLYITKTNWDYIWGHDQLLNYFFSHEFCKAYFGTNWKKHIQDMALSDDRFGYVVKFLKED